MTAQPGLFDVPRSRWSDPATSRQAAESVSLKKVTEVQRRILGCLIRPLTDDELVARVQDLSPEQRSSPQSIRSRRAELVRLGLVVDSGITRPSQYGKAATVWRLPTV